MAVTYSEHITAEAADDLALIGRIRDGDESALGILYDRWSKVVYSAALAMVRSDTTAEDVVECTFWEVWTAARKGRDDETPVGSWILSICRNLALKPFGSGGERPKGAGLPLFTANDAALLAGFPIDLLEGRRRIQDALEQLSEEQRSALELAYFQGLSVEEIAAEEGHSLEETCETIRDGASRLRHALALNEEAKS